MTQSLVCCISKNTAKQHDLISSMKKLYSQEISLCDQVKDGEVASLPVKVNIRQLLVQPPLPPPCSSTQTLRR